MAVGQTSLTSGSSATNGTSYNTASVTPTANNLILLATMSESVAENDGAVPSSVTGNGLTWVLVASGTTDTYGAVSLYRAMGASPSAGAVTINYTNTQVGILWQLSEFSGIDTGGTNGSAAVVQSAAVSGGTGTSLSITLAAFGAAGNGTFGTFGAWADNGGSAVTFTPGSGFTEIYDAWHDVGGWTDALQTEWRTDNDTTVDATLSDASGNWAGVAVEIKAAAAGGATGKSNPLSGPLGGSLAGPIG